MSAQDVQALPSFFVRNHLTQDDLDTCLRFAAKQWPSHTIQPIAGQGGCSFTTLATRECSAAASKHNTFVIQFRLEKHAIPIRLAEEARRIYSSLAPVTEVVGKLTLGNGRSVQVCAMSRIAGVRLSDLQPRVRHLNAQTCKHYETLLTSLAVFFARSWTAGLRGAEGELRCSGKVGSMILAKLEKLQHELPSEGLRNQAQHSRQAVEDGLLDRLPVVLTHGDMLPSNIMVDADAWAVNGYVDWAETEWLPFGVCLYGLDRLLSYIDTDAGRPRVVYHEQADQLREHFWAVLERLIPDMGDMVVRRAVMLARDVGILLWHGFAWDDGSIDRVVDSVGDAEELAMLHAFLGIPDHAGRRDSRLTV